MDEFRLNKRTAGCDRLIPENEAIEMLGLNERPNPKGSLRWLMRTRRLAFVKLARGIVGFRPSDIQDFVDSNRIAANMPNKQNPAA